MDGLQSWLVCKAGGFAGMVKRLIMGTYFQQGTSTFGVRGPFLGSGPLKKDRSRPYLCSVQWRASGVPSLSKSGHLRFQGHNFYFKTLNYPLDIGRRRVRLSEFHPKWSEIMTNPDFGVNSNEIGH